MVIGTPSTITRHSSSGHQSALSKTMQYSNKEPLVSTIPWNSGIRNFGHRDNIPSEAPAQARILRQINEAFLDSSMDHTARGSDWRSLALQRRVRRKRGRPDSGSRIPTAADANADGHRRIRSVSTSTTRFTEITGS